MTKISGSSEETFEIRRFLPKDEAQLVKAWKEAYPDLFQFKYPARWRWNIFENPFTPENNCPMCWVAVTGCKIAAWTCAMAVPITAAGLQVVGGQSVDTFTLTHYRRYGLGKTLQVLNQEAHAIFISIDLSPANRRNKYKIGGHSGKMLETWFRVGSTLNRDVLYESFLRLVNKYLGQRGVSLFSICKIIGLASALNFFCSAGLRLQQRSVCTVSDSSRHLTFISLDTFNNLADILWDCVVQKYSFAISRNSTYLNWKYTLQPNLIYRKVMVLRSGTPVGLLVYRFPVAAEQRVGIITECFCIDDDPAIHAAIVAHAIEDFERHGIDTIKCGASTENQREALRTIGFSPVKIDVPVFNISPQLGADLNVKSLMEKDWLLSLGDQDIDQIRPVQQPSFVDIVRIMIGKIPGAENLPC